MMKRLKVSENSRYLCYEDGSPFFYLGDTAWELFHRLTVEESERYLKDRAEKGFTVIQAVAVSELNGADEPNADGELPFIDRQAEKPNEKYFEHIDRVVEIAESLGMYIGMLPAWGCHWKQNGKPPVLFNKDNAYGYGKWLGDRYKDSAVIWIMGGDRVPDDADTIVLDELAKGLREGDGNSHLMTLHPCGPGQSSAYFPDKDWIDFNMNQTSHAARDHFNGRFIQADYARTPVKPVLDGEPRYEQIPVGFYLSGITRPSDRFDDYDARQAAYWSLMCGACGHTYGNNNIWQMYTPDRKPAIGADIPWYEAIHHPGARQMGYMRRFFERHHYEKMLPANELLFDEVTFGMGHTLAMKASDDSAVIVYSPAGAPFGLNMSGFEGKYRVQWFNPKYNTYYQIISWDTNSWQTYTPPTSGRGCDWMLVIERE